MECNKDEAVRARSMAEQKMQAGDFVGARKLALKARQLYPDIDNLSQLLTVCQVHCSSLDRINGSEMDWYGILQVEKFSDETVIKKQFRKLALALHPDKNKFSGAEAAFKLIGEAQRVLTDPTKRSLYDMKCKGSIRPIIPKPSVPNQFNRNRASMCQQQPPNKIPNSPHVQFPAFHHQQQQQPQHDTFWTSCSSCNTRFQYFKQYAGKTLKCQSCSENFIAHDLGPNAGPPPSTWSKFSAQNGVGSQGTSKFVAQKDGGKPSSTNFHAGFPKFNHMPKAGKSSNAGSFKPAEPQAGMAAEFGGGSEPLEKSNGHVDMKARERDASQKNTDATKSRKPQAPKVANKKRGRKSFEDASSMDDSDNDMAAGVKGSESAQSTGHSMGNQTRKSSRQKKKISYGEDASEIDEFVGSRSGKSKGGGSAGAVEKEMKEAGRGDDGGYMAKGNASAAVVGEEEEAVNHVVSSTKEQSKAKISYSAMEFGDASLSGRDDGQVGSDRATGCAEEPDIEKYDFPDQDFCNFDQDRRVDCFDVDQIWACYEPLDGMPRFYAWIRKLHSPNFKAKITWLEADPDGKDECAWQRAALPVACGKYRIGESQFTKDHLMFSHKICYIREPKGTYYVYPCKGETWALFRNWDVKWSLEPEKHGPPYQFEYVEILTNFDKRAGIEVAYLEKVKGFVSIFKRAGGMFSFHIAPGELNRFSHPIPAFRLTGKEGNGVLEGFMELDAASLPPDDFESGNSRQVVKEDDCNKVVNDRNAMEPEVKIDQGIEIPLNHEKIEHVQNALKLRRSPRDSAKRNRRITASQLTSMATVNNGQASASASANQSAGKPPLHMKDGRAAHPTRSPAPKDKRIVEVDVYDFKKERSEDKFEVNQVWALFCEEDGLPKDFAVVKRVDFSSSPKLHVVMLDCSSPPKGAAQHVCFGTFRANNAKAKVLSPSSFSHQVKAEALGKNKYDIYPRAGDIWAIYKPSSTGSSRSDEKNDGCDFVEVLEGTATGAKVVQLTQLNGSESFYMAPKNLKSRGIVMDIPSSEFTRFSHQCCAVRCTEGNGVLKGCWQIDPSSIDGDVILLD